MALAEKETIKKGDKEENFVPKIRIKLKSYDNKVLDNSTRQVIDFAQRSDVEVIGPIPLPTEIKRYTVNRSTFVHKDARDQFEVRVHKRLIEILNPNQKFIETIKELNLPAGVEVEIKITT